MTTAKCPQYELLAEEKQEKLNFNTSFYKGTLEIIRKTFRKG